MNAQLKKIWSDVADAASAAGRDPNEISLVAVVKGIPWQEAFPLYDQGQRDFGENRVVEALAKQELAPPECRWHLIGTLQSNKVRKVIGKFALIHSIDSLELAEKLSQCSLERGVKTSILLQANTSGEPSKRGLPPEEWKTGFGKVKALEGISVQGLMTIAPLSASEKDVRECFAGLRCLRDELVKEHGVALPQLSMGMSQDFKLAIAEGATIVRIGTALFAHRNNRK